MKSDVLCDASVLGVSGSMMAGEMTVVKEIDISSCSTSHLNFTSDFSLVIDDKYASIFGLVGSFDVSFGSDAASSTSSSSSSSSSSSPSSRPSSSSPVVLSTSP